MNNIPSLSSVVDQALNVADQTAQSAMAIACNARDLIRNNPDFFQKMCQVAYASLQLIEAHNPGMTYLSRFQFALGTYLMHDFYSMIKKPYQWCFPVRADTIDENAVLASLTQVLQAQLDPLGQYNTTEIAHIAKSALKTRLELMARTDDGFKNAKGFKDVLENQIRAMHSPSFSLTTVTLAPIEVTLKSVSIGERLTNYNWTLVDMGTVLTFFREWNFVDTAKWADRIGHIRGFQWVNSNSLDAWVVGGVCTGFSLKLVEASRKLWYVKMTDNDRRQARWDVITSVVELTFYSPLFLNLVGKTAIANSTLQWFAVGAKSLGLISLATRPKHVYFAPAA